MRTTLAEGAELSRSVTVDAERTIGFMGEDGRVYSTPDLLRDIEQTCRELLLAHADPGEDSVGIYVELKHMAATPPGFAVEITARVSEVADRRVRFAVTAHDTEEKVAEAVHDRFVVDTARTVERLRAKAAREQQRAKAARAAPDVRA